MPTGVYPRLSGDEMRARLATLKVAQSMPLAEKVAFAKRVIGEAGARGRTAIMFSGGRDSCAVALLAKDVGPNLLYCDTGLSSAGALARVRVAADRLALELVVVAPKMEALALWADKGNYPIGPKRGHTYLRAVTGIKTSPVNCCYHLKEVPAREWLKKNPCASILWGNRAADSNRRKLGVADHGMVHGPTPQWRCWSYQPIALFSDAEVASVVAPLKLQFESRAESGCQVCCTDLARKDNQLTRCFVSDRAAFDRAILSGLGQQILKARGEPCGERDVLDALAEQPYRFLRIPKIGKKQRWTNT